MTQSIDSFALTERRDSPASLAVLQRVDSVCDEFEELWKAGIPPRIEDFLQDTNVPTSTLLSELVPLDVDYRQRRGEIPSLREYSARFPVLEEGAESQWRTADTPPPVPLQPVARLGRFQIEAKLGEGTFGVVWKAQDTLLQRSVAIKQFRPGTALSDRDRFVREARVVAKLEHLHIVRVLELDADPAADYLVFEYVDGGSLQTWLMLRGGVPFKAEEAARLAHQLALGLSHIHGHGIVHRDFKPANVLLTKAGIPKIGDFGLARDTNVLSTISQDLSMLGTIPYMSPEQCRGEPLTPTTDIYSLGVVLYEMLAGSRPFSGTGPELIAQIQSKDPPPFAPAGRVPADLEQICFRALEKSSTDRYADAGAMAADLERFLEGIPLPPRPVPARKIAPTSVSRRIFLACTLGPAAAAGISLAFALPGKKPDDGLMAVRLDTDPVGATVVFIPLGARNGRPMPAEKIVAPGTSPVSVRLKPGDYLVVAYLPDGRFHEVYRHVPRDPALRRWPSPHLRWEIDGEGVSLRRIAIPSKDVTQSMAMVDGMKDFSFQVGPLGTVPPCHIPSFFVDPHEFTIGEYKRYFRGIYDSLRSHAYFQPAADDDCAKTVNFDYAVELAEAQGKRLLNDWEFEFLATARGRSRYPWGSDLPVRDLAGPVPGPVGTPAFDQLHSHGVSVRGIGSNVAEWVDGETFGGAKLLELDGPISSAKQQLQKVRGGNYRVFQPSGEPGDKTPDPRTHFFLSRYTDHPGIGFRCARSVAPRLTESDFARRHESDEEANSPR